MNDNITLIDSPVELPHGEMMMYQVDGLTEAIDTAKGRIAFLFKSRTINALYLFVPVSLTPISVIRPNDVLLAKPVLELVSA